MGDKKQLTLPALISLVVGTMIGGGAFNLPSDMAGGANSGAVIIGWLITGVGMLCLAFVYQNLAMRKPRLDGGIFSYARAGFGDYIGFNAAWGYWLSALLGNVAYASLLFGSLSYFLPIFGRGNNLPSVIGASLIIWSIHFLVLKGIREAAIVNIITTTAKLVPIFLFIILLIFAFNVDIFMLDFWGEGTDITLSDILNQVKSTMLVTLWTFIGIEGAVVVSGRAKRREDVGKATVIGLVGTLMIYLFISLLSLGIMNRPDLADLPKPSMAYVLEAVVGPWGALIINMGLVVSLLGATLGWTLLSAEISYEAGLNGVFPKLFTKKNKNDSPVNALWITNGVVQLFIIISMFSENAYQAIYFISGTSILLPYLFSALYQLKLTWSGEGYPADGRRDRHKDMFFALVATIYSVWLVYAAGLSYLLMVAILYAPGLYFYRRARKEKGQRVFKPFEIAIAVGIVVAAIVASVLMAQGMISPL